MMARLGRDRVLRLSKTLMSRNCDKYRIMHSARVAGPSAYGLKTVGRTETSKRPLYLPSHRLQRERRIRRGVVRGHLPARGDRPGPLDGNL